MPLLRTIVVVLSTLLFLGCSVAYEEVLGSYIIKYPYGEEALTLNSDGTYVQTVRVYGVSNVVTNKGKWEFRSKESEVILVDALVIDDFFGKLRKDYWKPQLGLSICKPRKRFGKITIPTNPDLPYEFEKIKP